MKNDLIIHISSILFASVILASCADLVQVELPVTQVSSATVYTDEATAKSALDGIYTEMMTGGFASGNYASVTVMCGLSSDEFTNRAINSPNRIQFYTNAINSSNSDLKAYLWADPYKHIYYANAVIDGLSKSSNLNDKTKDQLQGEALFVRALCHFTLNSMFGDIPVITTSDYRVNEKVSKSNKAEVYTQVIDDLNSAIELLPNDYSFSNGERIRPNQVAAQALLSRVYLYLEDWDNAEQFSSQVINNSMYSLSSLQGVFLANSSEAILQLMPVQPGINTHEGETFIPVSNPAYVTISSSLLNSFDGNDERKLKWIDSIVVNDEIYFYPGKYKVRYDATLTEYSMVLRLAEQYLIRAEARARSGNADGAKADLNVIRNRAGLPDTNANDDAAILLAIERERQVELFAEWGHRWFDLKRTGRANAILGVVKQDWQESDMLYPIPQSEILLNSNLLPQNPNY